MQGRTCSHVGEPTRLRARAFRPRRVSAGKMVFEKFIRYARLAVGLMVFEKFIRYTGLAVGLMVFEKFIRYARLAVGLKPSATECEARLRGLERIMYSKTMMPALPGSTSSSPLAPMRRSLLRRQDARAPRRHVNACRWSASGCIERQSTIRNLNMVSWRKPCLLT